MSTYTTANQHQPCQPKHIRDNLTSSNIIILSLPRLKPISTNHANLCPSETIRPHLQSSGSQEIVCRVPWSTRCWGCSGGRSWASPMLVHPAGLSPSPEEYQHLEQLTVILLPNNKLALQTWIVTKTLVLALKQ